MSDTQEKDTKATVARKFRAIAIAQAYAKESGQQADLQMVANMHKALNALECYYAILSP